MPLLLCHHYGWGGEESIVPHIKDTPDVQLLAAYASCLLLETEWVKQNRRPVLRKHSVKTETVEE